LGKCAPPDTGLFFVFGSRHVLGLICWWVNRQFGWRCQENQQYRRNEPGVFLRNARTHTWWLMSGFRAGGPLNK
jgi:hypothetical protein